VIRFVCVRVGPRYPAEYVAILADMIARNACNLDEFTIEAITDAPDELPEGVGYIPADPSIPPSWWAKVQLFSPAMPWDEGDRIIYFDLDVCITGRLEDLTERKGIIKDFNWPTYNSSVMVWDHGEHREAWDRFTPEVMTAPGSIVPPHALPSGTPNGGDQEWLTQIGGWDYLPEEWCVSYRSSATIWPPAGSKAVIFHGEPKPPEVKDGWVPDVWKIGGFTAIPELSGVNVSHDAIYDNVRANVQRDLPWFTGFGPVKKIAVLVGGAPSMRDNVAQIKAHKARGASIVSVNNAWRFLVENGITPDAHVMLDARAENAAFVDGAPETTRYFIASQCHPSVFDALDGKDVVLWHNGFGDNEVLREILQPWWEGPNARPCILVPGGGTVGLRALWLLALSGFKTVHVYGLDSSYDGDQHHAYAQPLNDAEQRISVQMRDKVYFCARWMIRQANEFRWHWTDLEREGVRLFVHGRGLLPDIAKTLRSAS